MKRKGEPSVATKAGATQGQALNETSAKRKKAAAPTIVRVVLDWMTNPSNYNGKNKEALLNQIVQQLLSVGIEHRDSAGVLEKINTLEKQFRMAEDFLAGTGAGITDEKDL
ncbi:hypothetical protein PC116_g13606 [Phytophthora cactorum]|nr:hypothetical protein PC122_g11142 [Phytophthora cactorum]KAG3180762.1 hypothetical protein PC128_g15447 [Phytophthora cactorum]KAG4238360.1 hypothetical protein PC116_g13606 [Phytophthora cactorum]